MTAHAPYLRILREPAAYSPAPMSVAKPTRALHIDPLILAHASLDLLACAVLAEVVDLHRVKGHVFADDDHFASRCKSKPRTIRDTISELVKLGFLLREVNYKARHKRTLTPTDLWQNPPEVVADSATTSPEVVADSAGSSGEICQDLWQNLPEVVADSANINTNLNTTPNTTSLNTPLPAAHAAAVGSKKNKGEEISSAPAAQPTAPPIAPRCEAPPKPAKAKTGDPEHFAGFWAAWPKKEGRLDAARAFAKLSADDQAAAASRADSWLSARPDLTDPARYRYIPHASTWLNQHRWTDSAPANPTLHGSPRTTLSPAQRQHHPPQVADYGSL